MKNWLRNQLGDWLLRGDDPPATRPIEVDSLDDAAIASRSLANDVHHRNEYATQLLKLLRLQIVAANIIFIVYAHVGMHWKIPPSTLSAYLGSVVVELIGLVYVVVRYLFPTPSGPALPSPPSPAELDP